MPQAEAEQQELGLFRIAEDDPNVEWLVEYLRSRRGWILSGQILHNAGRPVTEDGRRWVRALAKASKGRVLGGQRGYIATEWVTAGEYQHWRNWMKSQADEMAGRVVEADRVFYARNPVE